MSASFLRIRGAREHNLKNISLDIPREKLVVITGLSGSGKSSLAFDTIYAEGQRRYMESLSSYARQFLGLMEKPDIDFIDGLSPAISIEQKSTHRNPRSTVGTVTEIHDYLRLLFARVGIPHCPKCGKRIASQSIDQIVEQLYTLKPGTKLQILAPIVRGRKGTQEDIFATARSKGFVRVRINGEMHELEETFKLDKNKKHTVEIVIDRIVIKEGIRARLAESVETALSIAEGLVLAMIETDGKTEEKLFSSKLSCPDCGISIGELSPRMFSFNAPYGACPECSGLGFLMTFSPEFVLGDPDLSLEEGVIESWGKSNSYTTQESTRTLSKYYGVNIKTPWKKLSEKTRNFILNGNGQEFVEGRRYGGKYYEGVIPSLTRRYKESMSEDIRIWMESFMVNKECPVCKGQRLKPEVLAVKIAGISIADVSSMSIVIAHEFFKKLDLPPVDAQIAQQVLKEIRSRLTFLRDVGLDYLTLSRAAGTLSGGEAQRIRLATQIGSALTGVLYVLDEPSIGLHQRDNEKLLNTLKQLRDLGNTVIVVEHDEDTMMQSDWIVDMGPGAGIEGGEIVAQGTPDEILKHPTSLTGAFLSGKKKINLPEKRRSGTGFIEIKGATEHNLKNISVKFPLGIMTCITGVSGSGKSSLVMDILYKALASLIMKAKQYPGGFKQIVGAENIDKVIDIDQSAIGRTPRSNPATYTGLFTPIRDLFAGLPDSKLRGYKSGRFSFNVSGGRCEACEGDGIKKIEMHFLPDVYVTCEVCHGKRYNHETLEVRFKGKNIFEVLDMSISEARDFFINQPSIFNKLDTLESVGMGYVKLGQSATTLSGGEAQRIKLATELSKRATGKTIYILDEPTTGLHFGDVDRLLKVLQTLVDRGNTVLIIEHNLDVIKSADWIIDLGPEGGDNGGTIVAEGTPEAIAKNKSSYTGRFLQRVLTNSK
jgi:excinuclease ABC subunit A